MTRDWCVVLDTVSSSAANHLGVSLAGQGVDADVDSSQARIWCFADDEHHALAVRQQVLRVAASLGEPTLQVAPQIRVWDEQRQRYVDPAAPDEDPDTREVWIDSEITPDEVQWRVRVELSSVFEFRRVRRALPRLRRPVIGTGNQHIDLGARDRADADETSARALRLEGVEAVDATEIRGRLRRWLVRQRLAGNYAVGTDGSGPGYDYFDLAGGGGDGGGGGGGNGGGGHGGH